MSTPSKVAEQQDRCSEQKHSWRWNERTRVMACRCGAVHPNDLERFLAMQPEGDR